MAKPTVLYNGSCPICRREIEHYRDQDGARGLAWQDIDRPVSEGMRVDLSDEQVRQQLHVVDADGRVLVGVPAFARIWETLPRYRWLAALVRRPIVGPLAASFYAPVARLLYALDRRRRRRAPERSMP